MAWLHATPKPPEGTKQPANQPPRLSRIDALKRDKIEPRMPPNPAPHIITRFIEMGISEANGMGASPLSWREIMAWQEATCIRLPPWEARLMRRLSSEYLAQYHRSESETCPPPWRANLTAQDHAAEIAALDLVLG